MAQLSAYALLEGFSKFNEVEILSYEHEPSHILIYQIDPVKKSFHQEKVIQKEFLAKNYYVGTSFLQLTDRTVDTQIATLGCPFAITLRQEHFKLKNEIYQLLVQPFTKSMTVYAIQHAYYTISVSFCKQKNSFSISSSGLTIVCRNEKDINTYSEPRLERACQVAKIFFYIFSKFTNEQKNNFTQDLINRSLVGIKQFKTIKWFAIIEHYQQQRMLPMNKVKNFLEYYNLEQTETEIIQNFQPSQMKELYKKINDTLVPEYHDIYKGKTLYFWDGDTFLTSFFIPHKHFELLTQFKYILINSTNIRKDSDNLLNTFELSVHQLEFYRKYFDLMILNQNSIKKEQFAYQTKIAFNCVIQNLKEMNDSNLNLLSLSDCLVSTIYIVIPIGILGMGYEQLLSFISKQCYSVSLIKDVNNVNDNHHIYFIDHICQIKELNEIISSVKRLPYNILTIALIPESKSPYKELQLPFSFKFMMYCLSQYLKDKDNFQQIIQQIKTFQNQDLKKLNTDKILYCSYISHEREENDLYSELVLQDFQTALQIIQSEQLLESLSQQSEQFQKVTEKHLKHQALTIIEDLEKECNIKLRQRQVKFNLPKNNQKGYRLYIDKPNWSEINNFIMDAIDLLVEQHPQDTSAQIMRQTLNDQFFDDGKQIFEKETRPYLSTKQLYQKSFDPIVSVVIVVVDGIVILVPQDLGLNITQDIPIYSYNLDVTKSEKITKQFEKDIIHLYKTKEKNKVIFQQLELNQKKWNTYIVKVQSLNIRLIEKEKVLD